MRAFLLLALLASAPAHAYQRFYFEIGGGANYYLMGGDLLFASASAARTGLGFAYAGSFFVRLFDIDEKSNLQLGVSYRVNNGIGVADQVSHSAHSFLAVLRFELFRQYFISAGATPFMMTRVAPTFGLYDGLTMHAGSWAFLGEVGYQYRLTPGASIVGSLGGQVYLNATGWGPLPSLEGIVSLRFYLDAAQQFSDEKKNKIHPDYGENYEGWRYPYGRIR